MRIKINSAALFAIMMNFVLLIPILVCAEVLLHVNFDNHPLGPYTKAMAQADFHYSGYTWFSDTLDAPGRGTIVTGREGAGNALRVLYPAGQIGSASTIQIRAALKEAVDTAWASYWVKFDDDGDGFDFVKGGKLPGLCGGRCITGGNDANGYNGWSARIMWRREGTATQYMYYVTNEGFGEDLVFDKVKPEKRFVPGKWHRVNTQIIMNTPGIADGTIRSWFDGELSMEETNILIRHIDTLKIDLFYISTFFGGSDLSWAPSRDMYITYDDFLVVSKPESSPYPQALYELSAVSGQVPFTVTADLTASQNVSPGSVYVDFAAGNPVIVDNMKASAEYTVPGIYNFSAAVWNDATSVNERVFMGRKIFALGRRDLMCSNEWVWTSLGDTIRDGGTLSMYLTLFDIPNDTVMIGPAVHEPNITESNFKQRNESAFFGVLRYNKGVFGALSSSNGNYIEAPGIYDAGTYKVEFTFHRFANPGTYGVSLYDSQGELIMKWDTLGRRGYAPSTISYAAWASRDHAGVVHMEQWEEHYPTSIKSMPETSRITGQQNRKLPTVTARKNGISFLIPASSPSTQIEIFNAKGALVKRISPDGKTADLFIPVKSKGLYLYRMKDGNGIFDGSVIVK